MLQPKFQSGNAEFGGRANNTTWKVGQTLTIGTIIDHTGQVRESLVLQPQGIAHLVSAEKIVLPNDVCALAHVLTRKCNDGLLTLNIGVIDPGWNGKISTSILNFSSTPELLSQGDTFIRITFHQIQQYDEEKTKSFVPPVEGKPVPLEKDYLNDVKSRSVNSFGQYFLNIRYLVKELATEENTRLRSTLLKYIPIAAFSLAVFAFLVTLGGVFATRLLSKGEVPTGGSGVASQAEVRRLELRLEAVERQSSQSRAMRPASAKLPQSGASTPPR